VNTNEIGRRIRMRKEEFSKIAWVVLFDLIKEEHINRLEATIESIVRTRMSEIENTRN
jgi:hypothetical protein